MRLRENMGILGIDTIAIVVADRHKAIRWYRDVLGLDVAYIGPRTSNVDPSVQGTPDDAGHWIEMVLFVRGPAFTCARWTRRNRVLPGSRSSRTTSSRITSGCRRWASISRCLPRKWNGASGSVSLPTRTEMCSISSNRSRPESGKDRPLRRRRANALGLGGLGVPSPLQEEGVVRARSGLIEPSQFREDESFVHPSAAVTRIDFQGTVIAAQRVLELPEPRERVSFVVPGDFE